MKNTQKGFAFLPIILIVAAILAVGGGAYYYSENKGASQEAEVSTETNANVSTQTPHKTDTAQIVAKTEENKGWKTYANAKFGFNFKYPSDWKIDASETSNSAEVSVYTSTKRFRVFVDNRQNDVSEKTIGSRITASISVAGIESTAYIYPDGYEGCAPNDDCSAFGIPVKHNGLLYNLIGNGEAQSVEKYKDILATVKFTTPELQAINDTNPSATITSSSITSVSGTAKNVTSLNINVTAPFYGSIYVGTAMVVNGQWSLAIPNSIFSGTNGPYKVEVGVGPVSSSGMVNVLATATLTNPAFTASPLIGNAPLVVQFTLPPSAGHQTINYGDGTSCSTLIPSMQSECVFTTHVYTQPGIYTAVVNRSMPSTELGRLVITVK